MTAFAQQWKLTCASRVVTEMAIGAAAVRIPLHPPRSVPPVPHGPDRHLLRALVIPKPTPSHQRRTDVGGTERFDKQLAGGLLVIQ